VSKVPGEGVVDFITSVFSVLTGGGKDDDKKNSSEDEREMKYDEQGNATLKPSKIPGGK
jgi:hypothetical protein